MKPNKTHIAVLLIIILVAVSLDLYLRYKKDSNPDFNILEIKDDPLSLAGFVEVDVSTIQNSMVLTNNCRSLAMSTLDIQVYSIQQGLEEKIDARPLTHDIVQGVLENYDIEIIMVKITELDDGLYNANLFLKQDNKLLNLESKPSDAIALAIRQKAPIYIKKSILERDAQDSC